MSAEPAAPPWSRRTLPRRTLLVGTAALAAGSLVGCGAAGSNPFPLPDDGGFPGERASCVPRADLEEHRELAGLTLVYEVDRRPRTFAFEPGFFGQLEAWAGSLGATFGSAPDRLSTYGSWIDGGRRCDSWHHAGRAFDLARVRLADGRWLSCRYDQWRTGTAAEVAAAQRTYWRLAAELHRRFAYVLTYLYDDAHLNHVHVDNGRSGAELSRFRTGSRVQVQAVQAIATHLWDLPTETTGRWDGATRNAVRTVLDRAGLSGDLTEEDTWHGFLTASVARA